MQAKVPDRIAKIGILDLLIFHTALILQVHLPHVEGCGFGMAQLSARQPGIFDTPIGVYF